MESKLKTDRKALGASILFKILENKRKKKDKQKSIWDEFKVFSDVLGDDFMDYPDFEHFYLKLEKGECDLDYDGRPTYNRNLCDMPIVVIELISAKLTKKEKWIFRQTSSTLRTLIRPHSPGCDMMTIRLLRENARIIFESYYKDTELEIQYLKEESYESGETKVYRSCMGSNVEINGSTMEEEMIRDIRRMLEKPNTRLDHLKMFSQNLENNSFFDNLKPLLKSQENVRKVTIVSTASFLFHFTLSCLKSGTLEEIDLRSAVWDIDLTGTLEVDQLKLAKRLEIIGFGAIYPLTNLLHLEEFIGDRNILEPEEVLVIKEESTRTGKMKRFRISVMNRISPPEIKALLGPLNSEFNDTMDRRHFRIQNSDKFMRMDIHTSVIEFSRVTSVENDVENPSN